MERLCGDHGDFGLTDLLSWTSGITVGTAEAAFHRMCALAVTQPGASMLGNEANTRTKREYDDGSWQITFRKYVELE